MQVLNATTSNEAIIFIPPLFNEENGYYLDFFTKGLENFEGTGNFQEIGEAKIVGYTGKRFNVDLKGNILKTIDLYEAFWADIMAEQTLSDKDLKTKLFEGTELLIYWLCSSIWKSFYEVPSLIIGLVFSLFSLSFWYYGILLIVIKEAVQTRTMFGIQITEVWINYANIVGKIMEKWSVLIFISIIISGFGSISLEKIIDQAYFVKKYLGNVGGITLRNKIRRRVKKNIDAILELYDKVTIVAHSFGVIIATDILADYKSIKTVKYITLGGNLKLLSYRSKWINEEIKKCLNNPVISKWYDYSSKQDWLGAETPIPRGSNSANIERHEFPIQCDFMDRLRGITHTAYLSDPSWAEILLKDNG